MRISDWSSDVCSSDLVHEAAARWHDSLQCDPVSTEDRAAFEHWLGQSPGHRHAYAAVERVRAQAPAHAEDPRILALRQEAAPRPTRRAARGRTHGGEGKKGEVGVAVGGRRFPI